MSIERYGEGVGCQNSYWRFLTVGFGFVWHTDRYLLLFPDFICDSLFFKLADGV